jgi:hypothetical protein
MVCHITQDCDVVTESIDIGPEAGGIAVKNPFAARFVNYSKRGPE